MDCGCVLLAPDAVIGTVAANDDVSIPAAKLIETNNLRMDKPLGKMSVLLLKHSYALACRSL
jgi:hypothetical protein